MTARNALITRTALLFALLLSAARAPAQAPAPDPVPSVHPRLFATFPTPPADLPFIPFNDAWPDRWPPNADPNADAKGVIIPLDNPAQFPEGYRSNAPSITLPRDQRDVQAFTQHFPAARDQRFATAGPGKFLFAFPDPTDKPVPRARRNTAQAMFKFVSAQQETLDNQPILILEHTWFALYDPAPTTPHRGCALVSPGLLGTPPGTLNALTSALRADGWTVLRMLCQPSRFTEEVTFHLDPAADLLPQARRIAAVTGNRAAECAYAVEAAFAHVHTLRPALEGLPRVAVGFSGGAMTLPTIIAREPHRYSAAIFVGGGADFWLMNQRSSYKRLINAIHEDWSAEPAPETLARLDELYLRNAPLDSYHTAAALKNIPMLMIQGGSDLAVPAPLGDLLWERLGRPQRRIEDAGHEVLFMTLARDSFPTMMNWLREAAPLPNPAP